MYQLSDGREENYLLDDSGNGNERIIVFGRQTWLQHLESSTTWYADGTFSTAPSLFSQIYIILVKRIGGVHPILYALLQNKQ